MLAVVLYFQWVGRQSGGCISQSMQLLGREGALLKVTSQERCEEMVSRLESRRGSRRVPCVQVLRLALETVVLY